jgi:hypothetical protein
MSCHTHGTPIAQQHGMRDRRRGGRIRFLAAPDGIVRGFSEVVVQKSGDSEWIAIGRQAAVAGETLILDVDDDQQPQHVMVCVIESRPIILEGDLRHRIRLRSDEEADVPFEQQVRRG